MNATPDEKKKEEQADQAAALSDSELEQVSGGVNGTGGIHIREDWNDIAHPLAEP